MSMNTRYSVHFIRIFLFYFINARQAFSWLFEIYLPIESILSLSLYIGKVTEQIQSESESYWADKSETYPWWRILVNFERADVEIHFSKKQIKSRP